MDRQSPSAPSSTLSAEQAGPDGEIWATALKFGMIQRHLEETERHATLGKRIVEEQRRRVAELEREGHDVQAAHYLLNLFEEIQTMHVSHGKRLQEELDKFWDKA
ncbi:hypothetical protein WOA01_14560 [Methylocystis sp. IM2]|uniref:hypothetical protein n=1 Tax=Methylocystis sp. IM2 TaxID=3136563 RepID=UPI0030F9A1F6